jgi:tetratricopeptide (TPR) repeat protein
MELFQKTSGVPPTISVLDSLANEALRDVREGVKTYEFLLENNELESATKRLAEAFTVGEWVPEIRTLPRAKKRQALEFVQKSNQLLSTMESKDYTKAEHLLDDLAKIAKDFDGSKPRAMIESTRRVAQLRLANARNAALSGDKATLEKELAATTEMWPLNPQLAEVANMIFSQGDVQQKAVVDFDQLLGQKNYRQIYANSPRYIAALALYPDKQRQLQEVLQNMQTIEGAILRADEMAKQSNYPGAWESVEKIAADFPDDTKLNQMRADLTTKAADFVRTVRSAQELEKREQVGSSLAWFLKAKKLYPQSEFAGDGIERLAKRIVPEG